MRYEFWLARQEAALAAPPMLTTLLDLEACPIAHVDCALARNGNVSRPQLDISPLRFGWSKREFQSTDWHYQS
jgi:hypothetical protein